MSLHEIRIKLRNSSVKQHAYLRRKRYHVPFAYENNILKAVDRRCRRTYSIQDHFGRQKPVRMRSIRDPAGMLYQTLLTKKRGFDLSVQAAVYLFRRSSKPKALGTQRTSSLLERWLPALMYSCSRALDTGKRFTGVFQTKILLLSFSAAMQEYIRLGFHASASSRWKPLGSGTQYRTGHCASGEEVQMAAEAIFVGNLQIKREECTSEGWIEIFYILVSGAAKRIDEERLKSRRTNSCS